MTLKKDINPLYKYMNNKQICSSITGDKDSKNSMDIIKVSKTDCHGKDVNQKFITNLALKEGFRKVVFVDEVY